MRASTTVLEIVPGAGDPRNVVEAARDRKRDADAEARRRGDDYLSYDEVWCVFDRDTHPRFDEAITLASKHGLRVAPSNPSFELWLCLHFRDNPGPQTQKTLEATLKKHAPGSKKRVDFGDYVHGVDGAIDRATTMDRVADEAGEPGRNPTTAVYRLIEAIRQR
jgi:hypothetical protein